jgi:hypothetical protein
MRFRKKRKKLDVKLETAFAAFNVLT